MAEHPAFEAPETDVSIWRYMDFTKFVDVLEHAGLFFVRADKFDDPFEGSVPKVNFEARAPAFEQARLRLGPRDPLPAGALKELVTSTSRFYQWIRRMVTINSWHMNDQESAAMWKLYAKTNESIAIRSTLRSAERLFT